MTTTYEPTTATAPTPPSTTTEPDGYEHDTSTHTDTPASEPREITLSHNLSLLIGDGPLIWDEYIGQSSAKTSLSAAALSARRRGAVLPHALLTGPTGTGKTALACIAAVEMGRDVVVLSGRVSAEDALAKIENLEDGDMVILEEAHTMGRVAEEWLLHALEKGCITLDGEMWPLPRVTFVATTTDPDMLPPAVVSRMREYQLAPYSLNEAMAVVGSTYWRTLVHDGLPPLTWDQSKAIAEAANRVPRQIKKLLEELRDVTWGNPDFDPGDLLGVDADEVYDIPEALHRAGLTPDGLDRMSQQYLAVLLASPKPLGEAALKRALQRRGNLDGIERVLVEKDLITYTAAGRALTRTGKQRARELRARELRATGTRDDT